MENSEHNTGTMVLQFTDEEQQIITAAVENGAHQYFQSRRERVPEFIREVYSIKGALHINRKAFGLDLLLAPLNLFWAVPYLCLQFLAFIFNKIRIYPIARFLKWIPSGFQTSVQKEIIWRVRTELFELPYEQSNRVSTKDRLLESILGQEKLSDLMKSHLKKVNNKVQFNDFEGTLKRELDTYGGTRVASADLACSVLNISAGAFFFKKLTPGAITTGSAVAATVAHESAVSNFIFGETLGSFYYSIFPVEPSLELVLGSTAGILAIMGVLSAFAGVITDPFQRLIGVHQRRLNKTIDSIERNFNTTDATGFHPKDHYMARIFDVFDFVKTMV